MADREKVISGLEICSHIGWCEGGNSCPYWRDDLEGKEQFDLCKSLLTDALELLKEQEEVGGHWIVLEFCANEGIYCSKCMNKIFDRSTKPKKKLSNYCPNCGSKNTHFFNPSTEKIMYSD